jgi:hypothetical protein
VPVTTSVSMTALFTMSFFVAVPVTTSVSMTGLVTTSVSMTAAVTRSVSVLCVKIVVGVSGFTQAGGRKEDRERSFFEFCGHKPFYSISVSGASLGTSLPPTPKWSRLDLYRSALKEPGVPPCAVIFFVKR